MRHLDNKLYEGGDAATRSTDYQNFRELTAKRYSWPWDCFCGNRLGHCQGVARERVMPLRNTGPSRVPPFTIRCA